MMPVLVLGQGGSVQHFFGQYRTVTMIARLPMLALILSLLMPAVIYSTHMKNIF
jgi:hypothetical protein